MEFVSISLKHLVLTVQYVMLGGRLANVILTEKYPTIHFAAEEFSYFQDLAKLIIAKKKGKRDLFDRTTAEMGEAAIDLLLEKLDLNRVWMRGKIHYDFANLDYSIRLEVKTRKKYLPVLEELDVRLDETDFDNAKDSTHFVPVVFNNLEEGYEVITPGIFLLKSYFAGIEKHKSEIPFDLN
jgi:hypothetical protein